MGLFRSTGGAKGSWFNRRTPRIGGRCPYAWDIYRWEFCDYDEMIRMPDDICFEEMDADEMSDACNQHRWKKFNFIQNLLELDDELWLHLPTTFNIKPFKYNSGQFSKCHCSGRVRPRSIDSPLWTNENVSKK